MYKIILSLSVFFVLSTFSYSQTSTYQVKGNIDKSNNGNKVYLAKLNDTKTGLEYIDSTTVKDGRFDFTDNLSNNFEIRFIKLNEGTNQEPILIIPEKGSVTVQYSADMPRVGGTNRNNELQNFLTEQYNIQNEIQKIIDSNTEQVSEYEATNLNKKIEVLYRHTADNRYNYSLANIENDLGEFVFLTSLEVIPPDSIINLLSNTRSSFKDSPLGIDIKNYYAPLIAKLPGKKYTDIELKNPEGQKINLSDYISKGNIVLLDFWASWCGPCVREMPELVKLYQEYKNKGFQIVGISFDDSLSSWIKAIDRLHITWPQLSDLKGWESDAGKIYGIRSIPYTLLIDKNGIIIGNNIQGNELRSKLNKLLN